MDSTKFLKDLAEAIAKRDGIGVGSAAFDYAVGCYKDPAHAWRPFDDHVFEKLLEYIANEELMRWHGIWEMLYLFELDWATMSSSQQSRLIEALQRADRGANSRVRSVISETLNEYAGIDHW